MRKLIVRIKGGLGNQLFSYSAAKRLALISDAELVIDNVSGFARDYAYKRMYSLDNFNITARIATANERFSPFERYRRAIHKLIAKNKPYHKRCYIEQVGIDFDNRLLEFRVKDVVYIDGYWQSEDYFKDIEKDIRSDLVIKQPIDFLTNMYANKIQSVLSVGVHIRWFEDLGSSHNVPSNYYQNAILYSESNLEEPHYFIFSNDIELVKKNILFPYDRVTFVETNPSDEYAYRDLWLMSLCNNFITANSTFSWWGAWLGSSNRNFIITPKVFISGIGSWGFNGLIPKNWIKI